MIYNFTTLTVAYQSYARDFGEPFAMDQWTFDRYFADSLKNISAFRRYGDLYNSFGQAFDVELGLVVNKKMPNAVCSFNGKKHFILVEHMYPVALLEYFHRLMCNSDFLPDFGNTSLDRRNPRVPFTTLPGFDILVGLHPKIKMFEVEQYFGSLCPERRKAADLLYQHAMSFLYSHEFGHAILGHCLYAQQMFGMTEIDERSQNTPEQCDKKIIYLEKMADSSATWNTIGLPLLSTTSCRSTDDIVNDAAFRILGSSLMLYFLALTDVNITGGRVEAIYDWSDHPSGISRALQLPFSTIAQVPKSEIHLKEVMVDATRTACNELLRLAASDGTFRPYNWLRKDGILRDVIQKNGLEPKEKKAIDRQIKQFSFMKQNPGDPIM